MEPYLLLWPGCSEALTNKLRNSVHDPNGTLGSVLNSLDHDPNRTLDSVLNSMVA